MRDESKRPTKTVNSRRLKVTDSEWDAIEIKEMKHLDNIEVGISERVEISKQQRVSKLIQKYSHLLLMGFSEQAQREYQESFAKIMADNSEAIEEGLTDNVETKDLRR
jgi:hypothetical protein